MKETITGTQAIGQRVANAQINFIENVVEQFGFTNDEAAKILKVFVKVKAAKLIPAMGRYTLTHGAYWDKEVMKNALAM